MRSLSFLPFPELKTERLLLRSPEENDALFISKLRSDPENNKYLHRAAAVDEEFSLEWIRKIRQNIESDKSVLWIIASKDSFENIGTICLWNFSENKLVAETGYELLPEYHGKGYMSESMQSVLNYAASIGLTEIEAYTHEQNKNSRKMLESNAFKFVPDKKDPDVPTNVVYSFLF